MEWPKTFNELTGIKIPTIIHYESLSTKTLINGIVFVFEGNRTYSFRDVVVFFFFFVLYCFCQYIDNLNEKNWQKVVMNVLLPIFC